MTMRCLNTAAVVQCIAAFLFGRILRLYDVKSRNMTKNNILNPLDFFPPTLLNCKELRQQEQKEG